MFGVVYEKVCAYVGEKRSGRTTRTPVLGDFTWTVSNPKGLKSVVRTIDT